MNDRETSTSVLYDALPYIDATHSDYEEYAAQLIQQEMKRALPRRVEQLPPMRFRSPLMQSEYERVVAARKDGNDASPTFADPALEPPTEDTPAAWQAAVRQAKIAYEKERIRHVTLDISKQGGTAAAQWKQLNAHLDAVQAQHQQAHTAQAALVEAIHRQRVVQQEAAGQELHVLSTQYAQLVEKTKQLKQAVAQLQDEVKPQAADGEPQA